MSDRNKESLSALMDGEADELEIRRVLNQLESDDGLRDSWKNYHLMGSLMRDESIDSIDLSAGINKALDGEDGLAEASLYPDTGFTENAERVPVTGSQSVWYKPLTSVAVAASVTLAVLLGIQSIEPDNGLGIADASRQSISQAELTASTGSLEEQQDLEAAQQELQEYVLKHPGDKEKTDGVLPFARVVEFQTQDKQDK
jgi:sigma-E factor negative regulatory protein RseA